MSVGLSDFLVAFALYLVLEGLLPFLNPAMFKQYIIKLVALPDSAIRTIGVVCISLGLLLLFFMRQT